MVYFATRLLTLGGAKARYFKMGTKNEPSDFAKKQIFFFSSKTFPYCAKNISSLSHVGRIPTSACCVHRSFVARRRRRGFSIAQERLEIMVTGGG